MPNLFTSTLFLPLAISALCVSVCSAQQTTPPSTPQPPTPQQIPAQRTPAQRTSAQQTPAQQSSTQPTSAAQTTASIASPALDNSPQSVMVFVNDFELSVSPTATAALPAGSTSSSVTASNRPAATRPVQSNPISPTQVTPTPPAPRTPASVRNETDPPSTQARRMIDFFNLTLVQAFQQNHFTAVHRSTAPPNTGVLISGIFAEADPQNRVRRGLLGSTAPGSKFILYVGVSNLSRPRQPLYQLAPAQDQDSRYGPVITLNSYIPLTKFEVDKNPTEEDVRKICSEIVGNLIALLASNPAASSH